MTNHYNRYLCETDLFSIIGLRIIKYKLELSKLNFCPEWLCVFLSIQNISFVESNAILFIFLLFFCNVFYEVHLGAWALRCEITEIKSHHYQGPTRATLVHPRGSHRPVIEPLIAFSFFIAQFNDVRIFEAYCLDNCFSELPPTERIIWI